MIAPSTTAAAARLSQAIQIETVSRDGVEKGDAEALDRFQRFLQDAYPTAHAVLKREQLPNGALLYTWPGRNAALPSVIFLAHQDVVPVDTATLDKWTHPPFSGAIAEGHVWGRGALDMKGQLIGIMEAAETLSRTGFTPQRTLYLVFGSDEEASGSGAAGVAALLRERGVKAEFLLDEGPMVIAPFSLTGRPEAFIGVAEKGYGTLIVKARDPGGHSAVPSSSPAVDRLAKAILAIRGIRFDRRIDPLTTRTLLALSPDLDEISRLAVNNLWAFEPLVRGKLARNPGGEALLTTTISPTMLTASSKENVLPALATATMNVRLHPKDTPESVLNRARQATKGLPNVEVGWLNPPMRASRVSSLDSRGSRLISAHARQLLPGLSTTVPTLVFGATDSRFFQDIADDIYRLQPLVLTEADLATIHGVDERISLENLQRMIVFFEGTIRDAASEAADPDRPAAGGRRK